MLYRMNSRKTSSYLRGVAVIFPIVVGVILTAYGIAKLDEANVVHTEPWYAPYGFLVFGSTRLESEGQVTGYVEINADDLDEIERNVIPVHLDIYFHLNLTETVLDEVTVGLQFPFRIVSYQNLKIFQRPEESPVSIIDEEIIVLEGREEEKIAKTDVSVFYAKFNPSQYLEPQFILNLDFNWEGSQHRDTYSSFTQTFPVALSEASVQDVVYEKCPDAYIYYGYELGLSIGLRLSWDFETKDSSHPTRTLSEAGLWCRSIVLEPTFSDRYVPPDIPTVEMVMVQFEVSELSERRDRLLFDSGLYMGLGVGMFFSGIHEALRVGGGLRKRQPALRES